MVRPSNRARHKAATERAREAAFLLGQGFTLHQAARRLRVTPRTIYRYRRTRDFRHRD